MARDDFTASTKRIIGARAGFRCSFPGCPLSTYGPVEDPNRFFNLGVAAHISSAAPRGARYRPEMAPEQRSHSSNGIWLCQNHAKLIDDDETQFPIDLLESWKRLAEERLKKPPSGTNASGDDAVLISPAERHGWAKDATVDGRTMPLVQSVPFGADGGFPSYIVRFYIQKKSPDAHAIVSEVRAVVHAWQEMPPYPPPAPPVAPPIRINTYFVMLSRPKDLPHRFPAAFKIEDGRVEESVALVLSEEFPEVIDVKLNSSSGGIYRLSIEADIVEGISRHTHLVLGETEIAFLPPFERKPKLR